MKFLIMILTLFFALSASAGSMTINTTSAQDVRIAEAFGWELSKYTPGTPTVAATYDEFGEELTPEIPGVPGVHRSATGTEVKAAIVQYIRSVVKEHETKNAEKAARDAIGIIPLATD